MLVSGCVPVPEPFLWNESFDVGDIEVNEEHNEIMRLANLYDHNRADLPLLDAIAEHLRSHFEHEEQIMAKLLTELEQTGKEYFEVVTRKRVLLVAGHALSSSTDSVGSTLDRSANLGSDKSDQKSLSLRSRGIWGSVGTFDPIFEDEIVRWTATGKPETLRVDLRNYVLTPKVFKDHKSIHAIFLEDVAVLKRRLLKMYVVEGGEVVARGTEKESKRKPNKPFTDNMPGDEELMFLKNWYTQHVQGEDMVILHTVTLIKKLKNALTWLSVPPVIATGENTYLTQVAVTDDSPVNPMIFDPVAIWGDMMNDTAETRSEIESVIDSEGVVKPLPSRVLYAKSWLSGIRKFGCIGLMLLSPPHVQNKQLRIIAGSLMLSKLTGYHPWELIKVPFGRLVDNGDLEKQLGKWINLLNGPHDCYELERRLLAKSNKPDPIQCSIVHWAPIIHKSGVKLKVLHIIVPCAIISEYFKPSNLYFLDFTVALPRLPFEARTQIEQKLAVLQRMLLEACLSKVKLRRSGLVDYHLPRTPMHSWLRSEWKRPPLSNPAFMLGVEQLAYALTLGGFADHELQLSVTSFPRDWLMTELISHREMLMAFRHSKDDQEVTAVEGQPQEEAAAPVVRFDETGDATKSEGGLLREDVFAIEDSEDESTSVSSLASSAEDLEKIRTTRLGDRMDEESKSISFIDVGVVPVPKLESSLESPAPGSVGMNAAAQRSQSTSVVRSSMEDLKLKKHPEVHPKSRRTPKLPQQLTSMVTMTKMRYRQAPAQHEGGRSSSFRSGELKHETLSTVAMIGEGGSPRLPKTSGKTTSRIPRPEKQPPTTTGLEIPLLTNPKAPAPRARRGGGVPGTRKPKQQHHKKEGTTSALTLNLFAANKKQQQQAPAPKK